MTAVERAADFLSEVVIQFESQSSASQSNIVNDLCDRQGLIEIPLDVEGVGHYWRDMARTANESLLLNSSSTQSLSSSHGVHREVSFRRTLKRLLLEGLQLSPIHRHTFADQIFRWYSQSPGVRPGTSGSSVSQSTASRRRIMNDQDAQAVQDERRRVLRQAQFEQERLIEERRHMKVVVRPPDGLKQHDQRAKDQLTSAIRFSSLGKLKKYRTRDLFASHAKRTKSNRKNVVRQLQHNSYKPRSTVKEERAKRSEQRDSSSMIFARDQGPLSARAKEVQEKMNKIYLEKRSAEASERRFKNHTRQLLDEWSLKRARFDQESSRRQESALYAKQERIQRARSRAQSAVPGRRKWSAGSTSKLARPSTVPNLGSYNNRGTTGERPSTPTGRLTLDLGQVGINNPHDSSSASRQSSARGSRPLSSPRNRSVVSPRPSPRSPRVGNPLLESPFEHLQGDAWSEELTRKKKPRKKKSEFDTEWEAELAQTSESEQEEELEVTRSHWKLDEPWLGADANDGERQFVGEAGEAGRETAPTPMGLARKQQPCVAWGPVSGHGVPLSPLESRQPQTLLGKIADSHSFLDYTRRPGSAVSLSPYRPGSAMSNQEASYRRSRSAQNFALNRANSSLVPGERQLAALASIRPATAHISRRAELLECERIKTALARHGISMRRGILESALVTPQVGLTLDERKTMFPKPGSNLMPDPYAEERRAAAKKSKAKKTKGKKRKGKKKKK